MEAKEYVQTGLRNRLEAWQTNEKKLEWYEEDMIRACNQRCADVKKARHDAEIRRIFSAEQRAAKQAQERRERKATEAVKAYVYVCLIIAMVTTWTLLEWWAAVALVAGLAVFPLAYIFRLYYPIGR